MTSVKQKSNIASQRSNIESLFQLFSVGAMRPKPYVKKLPLPATVTIPLDPKEMELLQMITARIGGSRTMVAHHIVKLGLYEAAAGCGFTFDEDGNVPETQKSWDVTPSTTGFSFPGEEEAA